MTTVGVIGCGKQAPKHISGLKAAGIKEVIVADINPQLAADLAGQYEDGLVRSVDTVDEVLNDKSISAISICTPTKTHAPLIRGAVKNGKHYLCEKPLCETVAEAEELVEITDKAGLIGMVGYIYRFAPAFVQAKAILGDADKTGVSPVLGRITSAFFRIGGRGSHMAWKHQKATGGGAINEMMVHMLDLSQWFFGSGDLKLLKKEFYWPEREIGGETVVVDAEDWVLASMKADAGPDVLFQADFITPAFTQYAEIQGENGSFMGSIQNDIPSFVFCSNAAGGYGAGKTVLDFPPTNMFEAQMSAFIEAVESGKSEEICNVSQAASVLKTCSTLFLEN